MIELLKGLGLVVALGLLSWLMLREPKEPLSPGWENIGRRLLGKKGK